MSFNQVFFINILAKVLICDEKWFFSDMYFFGTSMTSNSLKSSPNFTTGSSLSGCLIPQAKINIWKFGTTNIWSFTYSKLRNDICTTIYNNFLTTFFLILTLNSYFISSFFSLHCFWPMKKERKEIVTRVVPNGCSNIITPNFYPIW